MWRDYVGLVAPTAAILNGFIAVLVAQFYKDYPIAKAALVVMAGVLGAGAIGATLYSQHLVIAQRDEDHVRRTIIREHLGTFIAEGNALMNECADKSKAPPIDAANEWLSRVVQFLTEKLGASYLARLNDYTGIPSMSLSGADPAHENLWFGIYRRVLRLEQFSQELPAG